MSELAEHRVHPVGVRSDVGQHPNVVRVFATQAGAECVRALALPLVEVAREDHTPHVQPQSIEGTAGKGLQVLPLEVAVEVDARYIGSPVEEWTSVLTRKTPKKLASGSEWPSKAGLSFGECPWRKSLT